jgi:hypothetical protein
MTKFEVGKFYAVQVSGWSRKKIPALCTRVTKCTVTFQYLLKKADGRIVKDLHQMRKRIAGKLECAYVSDKWSLIENTYSDSLRGKPKMWDEVREAHNGRDLARFKMLHPAMVG